MGGGRETNKLLTFILVGASRNCIAIDTRRDVAVTQDPFWNSEKRPREVVEIRGRCWRDRSWTFDVNFLFREV